MRKTVLCPMLLLWTGICLCLGACGSGKNGASVFYYGTAEPLPTELGAVIQTDAGAFLVRAVSESLWSCDADGNLMLKLAESLDYTGEELAVTLCPGVRFSGGNELTAGDVLFSFRYFAGRPETAALYECLDLDGAEMPDEYTLTIPLRFYDGGLIRQLGGVSGSVFDRTAAGEEGYSLSNLAGTGPYMLKNSKHTAGAVEYVLVRDPDYRGAPPFYDELHVICYEEQSGLWDGLLAGKLDGARLTRADHIDRLAEGAVPEMVLVSAGTPEGVHFAVRSGWESFVAAVDASGRVDPCLLTGR